MGNINSSSLVDSEVLGTPRTAFQRYQPGSFYGCYNAKSP